MNFDAVGKVGFGEGKCGSMIWGAFEVAEEMKLFFVVTVIWVFTFGKNE